MSEQEYYARDLALMVEINEYRKQCDAAHYTIYDANIHITQLELERVKLRQEYAVLKHGGQNND